MSPQRGRDARLADPMNAKSTNFTQGGIDMHRSMTATATTVAGLLLLAPGPGYADGRNFEARLSGFQEVHGPNLGIGAIFSSGAGRIDLKIDRKKREIRYDLSYDFPDADATPVTGAQFVNQAHLHFGQSHTTGGITVWLCQSADNPAPATAPDTPACPSPSGKVSGTILPQHVLGVPAQGLPAGEDGFDALLKALRDDAIYANVHTDRFPPGEIRGQLDD
jgi:hypothetical protein